MIRGFLGFLGSSGSSVPRSSSGSSEFLGFLGLLGSSEFLGFLGFLGSSGFLGVPRSSSEFLGFLGQGSNRGPAARADDLSRYAGSVAIYSEEPEEPEEPLSWNSYCDFVVTPGMQKDQLLPGVTTADCPPRVKCDAKSPVRQARNRELLRHGLQIALLLAVDYLFVYWPESRLPLLDREGSLAFLRGMNVVILGDVWLTRAMPKWSARRIAGTWSRREREKFRA